MQKATDVGLLMPTVRRYFDSDDLEMHAMVTACVEKDGRFAVILNETLFHPKGGGQPADTGWIGCLRVHDVTCEGGAIFHWLDEPVDPQSVHIRIDEDVRGVHSKMHTAGHLLGSAGQVFGWNPRKAHHWPGECKVAFEISEKDRCRISCEESKFRLERQLAEWIGMGLPRKIHQDQDQRLVQFGYLDAYPCGGTHLRSTGMVGVIQIKAVKMKGKEILVGYG